MFANLTKSFCSKVRLFFCHGIVKENKQKSKTTSRDQRQHAVLKPKYTQVGKRGIKM